MDRKVELRFEEGEGAWRIYWSCTQELADERWFKNLEEAGPVARALMSEAPWTPPTLSVVPPRDKT